MIYFIQAGGNDAPVKIGYTGDNDPRKRLKSLQGGNPYRLKIIGLILDGDPVQERALHYKFRDSSLEGEWFSYTPDLREFVLTKTIVHHERAHYSPGPLECHGQNLTVSTPSRIGLRSPDHRSTINSGLDGDSKSPRQRDSTAAT